MRLNKRKKIYSKQLLLKMFKSQRKKYDLIFGVWYTPLSGLRVNTNCTKSSKYAFETTNWVLFYIKNLILAQDMSKI